MSSLGVFSPKGGDRGPSHNALLSPSYIHPSPYEFHYTDGTIISSNDPVSPDSLGCGLRTHAKAEMGGYVHMDVYMCVCVCVYVRVYVRVCVRVVQSPSDDPKPHCGGSQCSSSPLLSRLQRYWEKGGKREMSTQQCFSTVQESVSKEEILRKRGFATRGLCAHCVNVKKSCCPQKAKGFMSLLF